MTLDLRVESLPILQLQTVFASAFYEKSGQHKRVKPLLASAVVKGPQGSRGTAGVKLTYSTRFGSHAEPVAILINQALRGLGYAVNLADLRSLFRLTWGTQNKSTTRLLPMPAHQRPIGIGPRFGKRMWEK